MIQGADVSRLLRSVASTVDQRGDSGAHKPKAAKLLGRDNSLWWQITWTCFQL